MQGTVQHPLSHSPCPAGFPGTTWPAAVGEVLVGECQELHPGAEALSSGSRAGIVASPLFWVEGLRH